MNKRDIINNARDHYWNEYETTTVDDYEGFYIKECQKSSFDKTVKEKLFAASNLIFIREDDKNFIISQCTNNNIKYKYTKMGERAYVQFSSVGDAEFFIVLIKVLDIMREIRREGRNMINPFCVEKCSNQYKIHIGKSRKKIYLTVSALTMMIFTKIHMKTIVEDIISCNGCRCSDISTEIFFSTEEDANRYISILEGYNVMQKLSQ